MSVSPQGLRFALVVMAHGEGPTDANLLRHERWIRRAAALGAQVVAFPECSLTGYGGPVHTAVELDSEPLRRIGTWAAELGVHVLVGLAERCGDAIHSSCAVVGTAGVLGVTRKIHCIEEEAGLYTGGRELPVFEVGGRRIGIAICADASIYEVPKILALRGAEIVFCPHANAHPGLRGSPERWKRWRQSRWQPFIADCGVYMLGCNLAAADDGQGDRRGDGPARRRFCGGALALGPGGEVLAECAPAGPREQLVVVDLPECTNPAAELLACLRPEILYGRSGWALGVHHDGPSTPRRGPCVANVSLTGGPEGTAAEAEHPARYYCAAALAFHEASTLGRYPLPPSSLRDAAPCAPLGKTTTATVTVAGSAAAGLRAPLAEVLNGRRSIRHFGDGSLPLTDLEAVLWAAYGRQSAAPPGLEHRTVPSAGGLFGLGIIVVACKVGALEAGPYAYRPDRARLDRMSADPIRVARWFRTSDIEYERASAAIVMVARLDLVGAKYGERGYRHLLLEAGHVGQNIALAATAVGIASVPAGGFDDARVRDDLGLARPMQLPIHCVMIGSR